ncbi:hypothetical protein [uncultured Cohaesibacter sp.]|nr:hypothetical protein [uncultured Cohaesibacter sp.]
MLFWNLFIQTLAIVIVVMLVGAGLSALAGKKTASSEAEGE